MQMQAKFVVACDHALIDAEDQISAIGIFDRLLLKEGKALLTFWVAGRFDVLESAETPENASIEIVLENGEKVGEPIILENTTATAGEPLNLVVGFRLFEFKTAGTHFVRIAHGESELYRGKLLDVFSHVQK